jgi:hypothetical protein
MSVDTEEVDRIYEELYGNHAECGERKSEERSMPFSRKPEQHQTLPKAFKLRVREVYYETRSRSPAARDDRVWMIFRGHSPSTGERKWKGCLPKVDFLHEYTVVYRPEAECVDRNNEIAVILKVLETRRAPLDIEILTRILKRVAKLDPIVTRRVADHVMPLVCEGIGPFLRTCGEEKWLKDSEAALTYFQDWYIADVLRPAYDADVLRHLLPAETSNLARLAVREPWKLCCWWMTDATLLPELDLRTASILASKFGGDFPETARVAVTAYSGYPFGEARARGDSYVCMDALRSQPEVLRCCLKHKIARIVVLRIGESYEQRICCIGDERCEAAVAEMIVRAVTTPELPGQVTVRPAHMRWPESVREVALHDRDEIVDEENRTRSARRPIVVLRPTVEQTAAIDAVMQTRLGVVCGKPGTGKTSVVMKALISAFDRSECLGVSFTGMAADNQRRLTGAGVTAHKVVHEWRMAGCDGHGHKYSGCRVLVIEEASAMSLRLLQGTLMALPKLRRLYCFGDHNQNSPPDGGASILEAIMRRYDDRGNVVSRLQTSMRVTDATGAFVRDLDRICECRVDDGFEWSPDPASGHPFVFLRRGNNATENVAIIRTALMARGVDPDAPGRSQVMVYLNATRTEIAKAWFDATELGRAATRRYEEHEFSIGERVMFLRNANVRYRPKKHARTPPCGQIMNGTCAVIREIFDHDFESDTTVSLSDTRDWHAIHTHRAFWRRWLRAETIDGMDLFVPLDSYPRTYITRVPPVTIDKMQGQEADYAVVLLVKPVPRLGAKGMYSACSRGRLGCFVVADIDPSITPETGRCPSRDFAQTIATSRGRLPMTDLWLRFPEDPATFMVSSTPCQLDEEPDLKRRRVSFPRNVTLLSVLKSIDGKPF